MTLKSDRRKCGPTMVLGIRNKNRRGPSIQVEYSVHVQDITPWPPTHSLRTVRSVLIQWENKERNSGATSAVTPSLDEGKIEFNESFRLPVMLSRDLSGKNGDRDAFHKNLLEFNLYELRRDKSVKGQLLGTAIVDLAEYGIVKEVTSVSAPLNCTRSFRNSPQPILHLRIQAYDRARSSSSLRGRLVQERSMDKNDGDSVSALMNEEYADEAEIGSMTDDDTSSLSSVTVSSLAESNGTSPSQNKENGSERRKNQNANEDSRIYNQNTAENALTMSETSDLTPESCQPDGNCQKTSEEIDPKPTLDEGPSIITDNIVPTATTENLKSDNSSDCQFSEEKGKRIELLQSVTHMKVPAKTYFIKGDQDEDNGHPVQILSEERHLVRDISPINSSLDAVQKPVLCETDDSFVEERPRHVKSVRSSVEPIKTNGAVKQEAKVNGAEKRSGQSDSKTQELERRIKVLETELREVAAMEVALYSIAAEHGSSINKVHTPARRLCRLYLQAGNVMKRASAAQSIISGLHVVAKACGNDVPRLTFWLSNCVVLRAIVSEAFEEEQLPISASPFPDRNKTGKGMNKTALKWKIASFEKQTTTSSSNVISHDLGHPTKFMSALEKLESWIFTRVVESVWWQTLTPHMQSSAAKMVDKVMDSIDKRNYKRTSLSGHQEQVNLSLELWKRAFKDACERLCPVRSGGHECGCLPVLAKLIMEQCVGRLDVAMFNAILRESVEDIPTDPVSDPISDPQVLPIPAGKTSFGAGAQLKNTIGNWSRWLADLFGIDDDEPDDGMDEDDELYKNESSFKSFRLLKSLSDLMMLPKDMLLSESVRQEVCPTFDAYLIRRVLENFVPDEFCPDPVPDAVFDALDSEVIRVEVEGTMAHFPCMAPAVYYFPPSASSLANVMGGSVGTGKESQLRRSASVNRRSNISDDELDELDSPLNSVLGDRHTGSLQASSTHLKSKLVKNHQKNVVRYQLLREVWNDE